jgi:hypothetical protein
VEATSSASYFWWNAEKLAEEDEEGRKEKMNGEEE